MCARIQIPGYRQLLVLIAVCSATRPACRLRTGREGLGSRGAPLRVTCIHKRFSYQPSAPTQGSEPFVHVTQHHQPTAVSADHRVYRYTVVTCKYCRLSLWLRGPRSISITMYEDVLSFAFALWHTCARPCTCCGPTVSMPSRNTCYLYAHVLRPQVASAHVQH